MRRAVFAVALLLAVPASAQEEPEPDTTDWHRYYPLEVGNEWQHYRYHLGVFDEHVAVRIVGDTLVEDTAYFRVEYCRRMGEASEATCGDQPDLIRYEEDHAAVVQRLVVDGAIQFRSWFEPCRLDLPFGFGQPSSLPCFDGSASGWASGSYGTSQTVGGDSVTGTEKWFSGGFDTYIFLSGLGPFQTDYEGGGEESLIYARIDGVEYGTPVITVTNEAAEPPERGEALTVFPNPLREMATLRFTLGAPQALTLEVFDVRGRRVQARSLRMQSAGERVLPFPAERLPVGAYVLRLRGDDGFTAQRGVIRLR